ncbi:MAG: hypothetical protein TYPL_0420 [Candidatus Tyloplasma litorale]|nr:MAG: hypothetical protein TYPL_0420 [Mycoplasmatales bacterium]
MNQKNKRSFEKEKSLESNKSSFWLRFFGWLILIFTVLSLVVLSIVSGVISYQEVIEGTGVGGIPLSLQYAGALFLATLIALLVIFLLVKKFFWKPMNDHLKIRKENIETNIELSSYKNKIAEKELKDSLEQNRKAKIEANKIIENSKIVANKHKKMILEELKEKTNKIIEQSREQIEKEKKLMEEDIREEIISTSILMAEKIIQKNLNSESNKEMIDELLKSLK